MLGVVIIKLKANLSSTGTGESFRVLILTLLESFRALMLKIVTNFERFRTLKLSNRVL